MINGTFPVFLLKEDYQSTITYRHSNNTRIEGGENFCYCNAEKLHPLATYDLSITTVEGYSYAHDFFNFVGGSQDKFCYSDPLDHYCFYPFFDTKKGIITEGVVVAVGSELYLAKKYSLGSYFICRLIHHPQENGIVVYNGDGSVASVSVDWDTGRIVSGGNINMKWSGYFYTPVRFENDLFPMESQAFSNRNGIIKTQLYTVKSLILQEVKDILLPTSFNLPNNEYNHTFQIPYELGYAFDLKANTSIIADGSGSEKRTLIRNIYPEVTISNSLINYPLKEYLISLFRLCLGNNKSIILDDTNSSSYNNYFTFNELNLQPELATPTEQIQEFKFNAKFDSAFDKTSTQYCHCWLLIRTDGNQYGFTNHDCELLIDGVTYSPKGSYQPSSPSRSAENTEPQTIELASYLTTGITEEEVVTDKFKDAKLLLFYYDWQNLLKINNIYEGFITSSSISYLSTGAISYKLFGESLFKLISVDVQVETSPNCRAKFLSDDCGRVKDGFVFQSRTITNLGINTTKLSIFVADLAPDQDGLASWSRGLVTFTSGKLNGLTFPIFAVLGSGGEIALKYRPIITPEIGDTVEIIKGCQKNPYDCSKYNNSGNYKGEPRASGELVRYFPSFG